MSEKWKKIIKIDLDTYKFEACMPQKSCNIRVNILQMCFDHTEERMCAIDSKGLGYLLEYRLNNWSSIKLGVIGRSTFVAFNPREKFELLVGLVTSDIKLLRLHNDMYDELSLFRGHELPPTWVSFYKNYCLTASPRDAIVWDMDSYAKIHQLQLEHNNDSSIRKAAFSSLGYVVALYKNDTIQAWRLDQFDADTRVCLCDYGMRNVKDFVFTENGRALIICGGSRKIIALDTTSWSPITSLEFLDSSSYSRRLAIVSLPLDFGRNNIVSILFDDGNVKFLDITAKSLVKLSVTNVLVGIRKLVVSPRGQWIASLPFDGSLIISSIHRVMNRKCETVKIKSKLVRSRAHNMTEHLNCIHKSTTEALRLQKLLPILTEFGEYPQRHRHVIWSMIMQLPGNKIAFAALNSKITVGPAFNILDNYKLADKSKANLLAATVERLSQLCPLLGQCAFLAEFVFPFLCVFQKDSLAAFEAAVTIFSNFCQQWHEYHPFPPLNILGIVENILMEADSNLLKFYYDHGITSSQYAWPLLNSAMSKVLVAQEWLILWDHLLSHRQPSLLLMCVVGYSICCRGIIFSLVKRREDLEKFFSEPGSIGVGEIIRVARRLDSQTSEENHPSRYLR